MLHSISATQASSVCLTFAESFNFLMYPPSLAVFNRSIHAHLPMNEVINSVFIAFVQVVGNLGQVAVIIIFESQHLGLDLEWNFDLIKSA